jgi:hypothetical protein
MKTIVLFRSGRHIQAAAKALRSQYSGCRLVVVTQPGTGQILDQLEIGAEDRYIYGATKFFSPFRFAFSAAGRRLRSRSFDRIAVLWNDPQGTGSINVNRTALLLAPKGFLAVTPGGSIIEQDTWIYARREAVRTIYSVGALLVILLMLILPAALLRLVKR